MATENLKMGTSWLNFGVLTVCQAICHGGNRYSASVNFAFAWHENRCKGTPFQAISVLLYDEDLFDVEGSILSFYKKL